MKPFQFMDASVVTTMTVEHPACMNATKTPQFVTVGPDILETMDTFSIKHSVIQVCENNTCNLKLCKNVT